MTVDWGPTVVGLLIPQRPPFLWVDRVTSVTPEEVVAQRFLSANDPVFAGHFPELPVLPGVLQLEALAQAAGILGALVELGDREPALLEELSHVELGARFDPRYDPDRERAFRERLAALPRRISLGGAVSAKWAEPVFPGCVLELRARLGKRLDPAWMFHVEARVGRSIVTTGTISGSRRSR